MNHLRASSEAQESIRLGSRDLIHICPNVGLRGVSIRSPNPIPYLRNVFAPVANALSSRELLSSAIFEIAHG